MRSRSVPSLCPPAGAAATRADSRTTMSATAVRGMASCAARWRRPLTLAAQATQSLQASLRRREHHLDDRIREAAAAGARGGVVGRRRRARDRRPLPPAVAAAGDVQDAARAAARRSRHRLREPARARHARPTSASCFTRGRSTRPRPRFAPTSRRTPRMRSPSSPPSSTTARGPRCCASRPTPPSATAACSPTLCKPADQTSAWSISRPTSSLQTLTAKPELGDADPRRVPPYLRRGHTIRFRQRTSVYGRNARRHAARGHPAV